MLSHNTCIHPHIHTDHTTSPHTSHTIVLIDNISGRAAVFMYRVVMW